MLTSGTDYAGKTVYLLDGTYNVGEITATIAGTSADEPVTIRAYTPGGVKLEAALSLSGAHSRWRDLEIYWNDWTTRTNDSGTGVPTGGPTSSCVTPAAADIHIINCILHDGQEGMFAGSLAPNLVVYGCLIYNNGWYGTDRGHGHSLYVQNSTGTKALRNNIILPGLSDFNIHAYATNGSLTGIYVDGNISIGKQTLFGAAVEPVVDAQYINNAIIDADSYIGYGFHDVVNADAVVTGNLFHGGLFFDYFTDLTVGDNILQDEYVDVRLWLPPSPNPYTIDNNTYRVAYPFSLNRFQVDGVSESFATWQTRGYDAGGSFAQVTPNPDRVIINPNTYDDQRAHVLVCNYSLASTVSVDLSTLTGLIDGQDYELVNAQNPSESYQFTYSAGVPVSVPMTGYTVAVPLGHDVPIADSTFPQFGAFVLRRVVA